MEYIALVLGVVGVALSAGRSRWCFVAWAPANLYWVWFNWPGIQALVFLIMTGSCFLGWILWSRDEINIEQLRTENIIFRQGWQEAQDSNIKLKEFRDNLTEFLELMDEPERKLLEDVMRTADKNNQ